MSQEREYKGIVQFYKKGKGFGFIREEGGKDRNDDIFVHHVDVENAGLKLLKPDQKVAYDVGEYDRKVVVIDEDTKEPKKDEDGNIVTEEVKDMKAINIAVIE